MGETTGSGQGRTAARKASWSHFSSAWSSLYLSTEVASAVVIGGAEHVFEGFRRRGNIGVGTSRSELALIGISATDQVNGGALAGECLVSQTLEVGAGLGSGPEVDLATLVDDQNLVGEAVDTFSGLVEGDEGGLAKNIGHDSHRLDEIQGGTGVQTMSGVIPGLNRSV